MLAWSSPPLTRLKLQWALGALLLAAAPFVNDVPLWIIATVFAVAAWRYLAFVFRRALPHTIVRLLLTLIGLALVWTNFGTINGLEAGTALLLVMAALKLTETARSRDLVVIIYMAFFLVVGHALFDQSIAAAGYATLSIVVFVAALIQVSRRTAPAKPQRAFAVSATLLAQALPLALLLFLLFPRVPGPFWSLPTRVGGTTGLSDTMEPGSIASLLRSAAVAFRVEFDGEPPPPNARYWRGPVLDTIAGRRWRATPTATSSDDVLPVGDAIGYTVTLEAHQRQWLFALDIPWDISIGQYAWLNANMELIARQPVKERFQYKVRSHTRYRLAANGLGPDRARFLDTARTHNPRTQSLARSWRAQHVTDEAIVQAALNYFNRELFVYTLQPPLLPARAASDAFLFSTRRGFCEHYASSFALLMRYAGIPARVVTGYQGGELNPLARHFTIRQSDAHAWNEVWLEERGWVRVDPTGAVAPERVEDGINGALSGNESLTPLLLGSGPFLTRLRHGWDAANAAWNERVLGYSRSKQLQFLRRLGFDAPSAGKLVAMLTVGSVVMFGLLSAFLAARARPRERNAAQRAYQRFCAKLAKLDVRRHSSEGPLDYAERAAQRLPKLADQIQTITQHYVAERYGAAPSAAGTRALRTLVKEFPRPAR